MALFSRHRRGESDARTTKDVRTRVDEAKRDLEDLHIIRLAETLTKIQDLLDICKNNKRNQDAIHKFTGLVASCIDDLLEPILREKKCGEVEISKTLTYQLEAFVGALFHAIPDHPRSTFNRWSQWLDISNSLVDVNRNMEEALQILHSKGTIRCDVRTGDNRRVLDIDQNDLHSAGDQDLPERSSASCMSSNDLEPTVDGVLKVLPRFRILLLGKSGVGKSSLINDIFGVPYADVAQFRAGNANINDEITSKNNPYFVLHDSIGYEAGSMDEFKTVQDFIIERGQKSDISQQLHAIWLCATIPMSGSRVFEVGDEALFKMDLGRVPLIVVFTKYDEIVASITEKLCANDGMEDPTKLRNAVEAAAEERFGRDCIQPLEDTYKKTGRTGLPPFIKVSVTHTYEATISELVQLTRRKINATAWLTWAIAQRADPEICIEASIDVGRKKFWRSLGSSLNFQDKALKRCLDTIHDDIVRVWNLYDPNEFLKSDKFKSMMIQSVDDLLDKDTIHPKRKFIAPSFAGLFTLASSPTPTIVGPITLSLAKWAYDIYKQSPGVLRCFMAYIVGLTVIMQRLFYLLRDGGIQPLPEQLLEQAFEKFSASNSKASMHREIRSFVDEGEYQDRTKDKVIDEIVRLIKQHRFNPVDEVEQSTSLEEEERNNQ